MAIGIQHSQYVYNYYVEPNNRSCRVFKNEQCYWPRGKTIGGSGAVNYLIYLRGNRRDYDTWLEMGNPGWGFDDVWPYFEKSVTPSGNDSQPQGYIDVNYFDHNAHNVSDLTFEAAQEMGQSLPPAFDKNHFLGYAFSLGTVKDGHRTTTAKGYLTRVSERKNLQVIKNAQVTKLHFQSYNKTKVTAVEFVVKQRRRFKVRVKREVILSAGSIDTPKLLMLSGIGPKEVLKPLRIPVLQNLPVGENLQDHVLALLFVKFNGSGETFKDQLATTYEYLVYRKGRLAVIGDTSLIGLVNVNASDVNSPYPNVQILQISFLKNESRSLNVFLEAAVMKDDQKDFLLQESKQNNIILYFVLVLHPKSRGTISLTSRSYKDPPKINANYFAEKQDAETQVQALEYMAKFVNTSAFRNKQAEIIHIPLEECDEYEFQKEEYWRCYIKYMTTTCYHPVGTAKMGSPEDSSAVVDSRLRVKGVQNLRVVDASIMPTIPSVNTNGPTIMIAEKAADMVTEDWNQEI